MLMQRRRVAVMITETFLVSAVAFVFWSVLWWIAEFVAQGTGLGRHVNDVIVGAVCLPLAYYEEEIHQWSLMVTWQRVLVDIAALLPVFAIVAHERDVQTAFWFTLLPVFFPLLIRAVDREEAAMKSR